MEPISNRHVRILFDEGILLPDENPANTFSLTPYDNQNDFLEIEKAEYEISDTDLKTIILTTAEQKAEQNYIVTAGINLTSLSGNPVVSGVYDTGFFIGSSVLLSDEEAAALTQETPKTASGTTVEAVETNSGSTTTSGTTLDTTTQLDITPPENITDLMVTQKLLELNEYLVTLTWTPSINSAGDLIDQIIYKSLNRGTDYDSGLSLGLNATKYETRLEGGKEYTFKITTKDRSGNESTGVIKSIRLPQTGPEGILLFASMLSGLGATQILKRKRK